MKLLILREVVFQYGYRDMVESSMRGKFCVFAKKYCTQACQISGFRPDITGFFIALSAFRLSHENLRQNHKISGMFFSDNILKFTNKINWLEKRQLRSHFTAR